MIGPSWWLHLRYLSSWTLRRLKEAGVVTHLLARYRGRSLSLERLNSVENRMEVKSKFLGTSTSSQTAVKFECAVLEGMLKPMICEMDATSSQNCWYGFALSVPRMYAFS
jgi:hypothetical protein